MLRTSARGRKVTGRRGRLSRLDAVGWRGREITQFRTGGVHEVIGKDKALQFAAVEIFKMKELNLDCGLGRFNPSPNALNPERVELPIGAENGDIVRERLGRKHSIKWVAMLRKKSACSEGHGRIDGNQRVSGVFDNIEEFLFKLLSTRKTAKPYLGCDFPCRSSGDQDHIGIIRDYLGDLRTQTGRRKRSA